MSNFNLIDAITGIAQRNPGREAISTVDASYTYADLLRVASQCARYFATHGIAAGDGLAIAVPRTDDAILAMLASWMVGATCMLIDPRIKQPEKALLAKSFGIRAVVEPRSAAGEKDYLSIPTGDGLLETVANEADDIYVRPAEIHPAIIIRTSGTTGAPVGVVYNHETMMCFHWAMAEDYYGFNRGVNVQALPIFYAFGTINTLSYLLDGSTTHILPPISSAEEFAEKLLATKARHAAIVPPQMLALLNLSEGRKTPMFPDLALLMASGGRFPADQILRAHMELSGNLVVAYGASFGGSIAALFGPDVPSKPDTVGKPLIHTHLRITDFDGNPVKQGEAGLICVRSPSIADAVVGEARALSDRMVDGWAIPGDLGFLDEEGFLTLTGRAPDLIIRKGVNVYPREIESVFERRDDVVEAAAIGYQTRGEGEEIAVFVAVRPGVTVEMLSDYARANLVADKRPRRIHIIDKLPRNDAGKVLNRVLVEMIEAEEE